MSDIDRLIDDKGTTCDVYSTTKGKGSAGGRSRTPVVKTEGVPCFIDLPRGGETVLGGQEGLSATHVFYFKAGVDIERTDLLLVSRNGRDDWFTDLFYDDPHEFGHHVEIYATIRR